MDSTRQFITRLSQAGGMTRSKLRRLKARRWKYPLSLERQYTASISRYLSRQWKEYAAMATRMMVPRADAVEDLSPLPGTTGPALGAIMNIASSLDEFNRKEMDAFRKIAVGEAFQEDEPWVKSVLDTWSREQVSLITKASQDMRDAVARRVRDGVKEGLTGKDIERMVLQEMPGISFRRARVIARDQASKLNASLTQGRMADAGLSTYIWDTAQDERVRGNPGGKYSKAIPSHWEMQGRICRWDDPTVCLDDNGEWVKRPPTAPYFHPGMAIMCRCVALPNWQELEGVKDSGLPAVEPVAMPAAVEPAPVVADDAVRVRETARSITDTLVKKGLLKPEGQSAWRQDLQDMIARMPEGWRKAWMDTAAVTKIQVRTKSWKASRFLPESGDIQLTAAMRDPLTVIHEIGHATMAKLSDPAWLEEMYARMAAAGPTYAKYIQPFKNVNHSIFRDRGIQAKLGNHIRKEWLDDMAAKMWELPLQDRLQMLRDHLSSHGVTPEVNTIDTIRDWLSLAGKHGLGGGHPISYRDGFTRLGRLAQFDTYDGMQIALSIEAGAEFMELAASEQGLKFLRTFLPDTLEFFEKEILGL